MRGFDFFFGNKKRFELTEINERGCEVDNNFFTKQINRYLMENKGRMELFCEVSAPSFSDFLSHVNCEEVGNVKIYSRNDLNHAVNATLSCEILMDGGVITITTQWCAYKTQRAQEIVSTLLVPIYLMELQSKTYLRLNAEELNPLIPEFGSDDYYEEMIHQVFWLAEYSSEKVTQEYIDSVSCAKNVGLKKLSMFDALCEYVNRLG